MCVCVCEKERDREIDGEREGEKEREREREILDPIKEKRLIKFCKLTQKRESLNILEELLPEKHRYCPVSLIFTKIHNPEILNYSMRFINTQLKCSIEKMLKLISKEILKQGDRDDAQEITAF